MNKGASYGAESTSCMQEHEDLQQCKEGKLELGMKMPLRVRKRSGAVGWYSRPCPGRGRSGHQRRMVGAPMG